MKQLTKAKAEQIARRIAEHYGEKYVPIRYEDRFDDSASGYYGPWVFPGEHEEAGCNWIISWEVCPEYAWAYQDPISEIVREVAPEFYAEAISHIAVGFYEA